jgi:hypothetical protein
MLNIQFTNHSFGPLVTLGQWETGGTSIGPLAQ